MTVFTRSHTYDCHFMCTTLNSQRAGYQEEFTLLDPSGPSTAAIHPVSPSSACPSALMSSAHPSVQPSSMQPNLLNHDTLTMMHDKPEANPLARAINNLVKSNMSTSRPRLCEPNPFNGSDLFKLRTFILQCKLNFQDQKDQFENKEDKVNYALSYLKGLALDCFKPALLGINDPIWILDFELFIEELETNFGTFDPEGEAKAKLEQLCMHENHQATKYFIKFQQLTTHVRWGNAALCWQAYNSLAKCIKNDLVHHSKPNTLVDLHGLAQAIDTCYWECKAEIA